MKLRVLIVYETAPQLIAQWIRVAGYEVVASIAVEDDWQTSTARLRPDIIVINTTSPGRGLLRRIQDLDEADHGPVVIFTEDSDVDMIRAAVQAGVISYVVNGLHADRIKPIIDTALARFEEIELLKKELNKTSLQLQQRKIVERAKGIVMQQLHCTEDQAYARMRDMAMSRNLRLYEVANSILTSARVLAY